MAASQGFRNRIVGHGDIDPSQLLANPRNWRIHPKAQQDALAGVLDEVGWVDEVLVNRRSGFVVDGHLRVALAISREEISVPVKYVDLNEEEEMLVLATLDPLASLAASDKDKLEALLLSVKTDDSRVQQMLDTLAKSEGIDLSGGLPKDPGPQIDRAAELQKKWGTELGQIWELGNHRLAVGDCTDKAVVDAVMMGERADAVITDPPYGIGQEGILNDDPKGLRNLYDGCLATLPIDNAVVITFQSPRLFWIWLDAVRDAGHKIGRILWLYRTGKPRFPWHGWYMHSDAILVSLVGNPIWPEWTKACPDTYEVNISDGQSVYGTQVGDPALHSAIKPWRVIENLIAHTQGIVFDPFLGSGTTMVATHRLGRRCFGVEVSPSYCGVILERMNEMGIMPYLNGHI